jgi:predicted nucleic acid-binding protein
MPTLDTSLLIDLIRHDPEAMRTLADGFILAQFATGTCSPVS